MTADRTEPLEQPVNEPERSRAGGRAWRGFTGSVAAGLAALAVVVTVASGVSDSGGPGASVVVWHIVAAVAALGLQVVFVDRRQGAVAGTAGLGVLVVTGVLLWTCWWA
ncbi:hypothetical protein [Prauserella rugosa]|uniref:Uncharacterized protein n=1 Tax=Prauserella rugosa TaxID=43354 RepID=A0A660CMM2_9PSEU|nr:hypothetical protein [Prauserella rugosa]KMS88394.1 hypothetical protein ACZ91_26090 [Streptomyces regensis]TWH22501.1 hypothetical protein JD82_04382 [Prauserella rugosa]